MIEVQSLILNIAFPKSLDEVLEIQKNVGKYDIEVLIDSVDNHKLIHSWSVSKWIKPDDIIFFMHSKSSIHTIARLRNELKVSLQYYNAEEISLIETGLERGLELYRLYGGKIFAIGKVDETPMYVDPTELKYNSHWKSRIYAYVENNCLLEKPIDLSEFNSFIKLSCGGSITPVYGKEFEKLKALIATSNEIPSYLDDSVSMPIPLSCINTENWIQVTAKYRNRFLYESQFRTFYVDYFLKVLGDRKKIYRECACKKSEIRTSFIDNIIIFGGLYLPVEVKLSVKAEQDIIRQIDKYCNLDVLYLDSKKEEAGAVERMYQTKVLVIDTTNIYLYSSQQKEMAEVCTLDNIHEIQDILDLRTNLLNILSD